MSEAYFQVEQTKVFPKLGIIKSPTREVKVRPKSMSLLAYMLEHRGQILSKSQLLSEVWDDVEAQEHVLFQSINEIRTSFDDLHVIKTHPRKGYEWVADTQNFPGSLDKAQPPNRVKKSFYNRFVSIFSAVCLLLVFSYYFELHKSQETSSVELVVLPVNNAIADNQHGWVRLGAMDMLISQLQQQPSLFTVSTEDVLTALDRTESFNETDDYALARILRYGMGEVTTLHTRLLGAPMEYQLHYTLIDRHSVERGLVMGENVRELLLKLSTKVAEKYGHTLLEPDVKYKSLFLNEAYVSAMENFFAHKFDVAESFFKTVVENDPGLLTAKRFLAASLMHQGKLAEAHEVATEAILEAQRKKDVSEELRTSFVLGMVLNQQQRTQEAHSLFETTRQLAYRASDKLYVAYAMQSIGELKREQQQWQQAESYFETALDYHRQFQCPYGQTSNLISLGLLNFDKGNQGQGDRYMAQALDIATTNELVHAQIDILLLQAAYSISKENISLATTQLSEAMSLARIADDKGLIASIEDWQRKNSL